MLLKPASSRSHLTRRTMLAAGAALAATPALAQTPPFLARKCEIGPPPHDQGALVFMDYDQLELDAAYHQRTYEPLLDRVNQRLASNSADVRARIGEPQRVAYGPTGIEMLDVYRAGRAKAPIFVFIHGGIWLYGSARDCGYAAEMFVNAGAHFIAIDFSSVRETSGDLGVLAAQVRRAIAWVRKNAESFDGDPERLYIGGHSSGGHLCGVALVTDWQGEFGLPADTLKGGLCMSGMFAWRQCGSRGVAPMFVSPTPWSMP